MARHDLHWVLVHLLPAMSRPTLHESLRAALGAGLALGTCGLVLALLAQETGAGTTGLVLIAPLGATAFLLFAVPNSPLAQPWSAFVGNVTSALVALVVVRAGLPMPWSGAVAVFGAVLLMALLRAQHPPGAAVALSATLAAPMTSELGWHFVLAPVALDTAALILLAVLWTRATGRVYPFRLPVDAPVPPPRERAELPSAEELDALLTRMNMEANIGVEDLTRVLEEIERAHPHVGR